MMERKVNKKNIREGRQKARKIFVTSKVFLTVTMKTAFFWNVTTCSLLGTCQHFGRTCCLHLQDIEDDSSAVATLHSSLEANILFVFSH